MRVRNGDPRGPKCFLMVGKSALFKNQKKKRARVFRTRETRNSASRSAPHARETMVSIAICRAPFGDLGEKPVRGNTESSGKCYEVVLPCLIVEEATQSPFLRRSFFFNVWGLCVFGLMGTISYGKKRVFNRNAFLKKFLETKKTHTRKNKKYS